MQWRIICVGLGLGLVVAVAAGKILAPLVLGSDGMKTKSAESEDAKCRTDTSTRTSYASTTI